MSKITYVHSGYALNLYTTARWQVGEDEYLFSPHPEATEILRTRVQSERKHHVIPYRSIDREIDDELFPLAKTAANELVGAIKKQRQRTHHSEFLAFPDFQHRPFEVLLIDRLANLLRGPFQLVSDNVSYSSVEIQGAPDGLSEALLATFAEAGWVGDRSNHSVGKSSSILPSQFRRSLPRYSQIAQENSPPQAAIAIAVHSADINYRQACFGVLDELVKNPARVSIAHINDRLEHEKYWRFIYQSEAHAEKLWVREFYESMTPCQLKSRSGPSLADEFALIANDWITHISQIPKLVPTLPLLRYFALSALPRLLAELARRTGQAKEHINGASCVVVMPGRPLFANLCVELANFRGLPTIEIQTGTVTATERSLSPRAKYILANDTHSHNVFTKYLNHSDESCHIVGSPKIDRDTMPVRELDTTTCLEEVLGLFPGTKTPPIVLATQPIGVDNMKKIVNLFVRVAAKDRSMNYVIKPHPKEPKVYLDMYREMIDRHKAANTIVLGDFPLQTLIKGSAGVATFYSTVGLEGYALGKPVARICPFDEPPGYDLVEMGIATDIKTPEQLVIFVRDALHEFYHPPEPQATKEPFLRDGLAGKRCADFIFERAREYALSQTGIDIVKPHVLTATE